MGVIRIPSDPSTRGVVRAESGWAPRAPAGFISSSDCAAMLGIGDNQLRAMRSNTRGMDTGPAFFKMADGHHIVYRLEDIKTYFEQRAVKLEAKAAAVRAQAVAAITGPFGGAPAVASDDEAAALAREAEALR